MTRRFQLPSFSSAWTLLSVASVVPSAALLSVFAAFAWPAVVMRAETVAAGAAFATLGPGDGAVAGHSATTATMASADTSTPAARNMTLRLGRATLLRADIEGPVCATTDVGSSRPVSGWLKA